MGKSTAKPRLIILEGTDRVGKNSLQDAIDQQTRYKHLVMDRGPIGFKAYCEIYEKSIDLFNYYVDMEEVLAENPDVLIIYLTCETEELIRRCKNTNHEILDFDLHRKIYDAYYETSLFPEKVKVDTTNKTSDEIVKELIELGVV